MFALGFVVGYFVFVSVTQIYFKKGKAFSTAMADKLVWYVVLGTIIGARLGHVFFYEFNYYLAHPMEIIMVRNGGLASHGGTLGVLLGLYLFLRWNKKLYGELSYLRLIDLVCIPTAFVATCIRLGNFINQEIVGLPSTLPWSVIFLDPAEGGDIVPRHPTQLYEALIYFATFIFLFTLWKKYEGKLKTGLISGLFFIAVFGSRFFIEFIKIPQSAPMIGGLQTGQLLSLPFVLLGLILLINKERNKDEHTRIFDKPR